MVQSAATSVAQYLKELPADRRKTVAAIRKLVNQNLPKGYKEGMQYGMIGWFIPLSKYPETYNKQPLGYAALAAQKNYTTLYLMSAYADSDTERELIAGFKAAGKKLNMGKCCIRFKAVEDLALEPLAEAVAAIEPDEFIEVYETARKKTRKGK